MRLVVLKRSRIRAPGDASGITITSFVRHRGTAPVSPTVPFPSNQRGEAGSRRSDIEGSAASFPQNWAEASRGKSIELCPASRPPARLPACPPARLSPGRAAGIMGMQRLRSQQSHRGRLPIGGGGNISRRLARPSSGSRRRGNKRAF